MLEVRINHIDRKDSISKIIVDCEFANVTRATGIDEFGNSYEYVSSYNLISASSFEFIPDFTDKEINNYLINYLGTL